MERRKARVSLTCSKATKTKVRIETTSKATLVERVITTWRMTKTRKTMKMIFLKRTTVNSTTSLTKPVSWSVKIG